MNKSQLSDFNFDNVLDITQNRKDKTDQFFSKEGVAFEDFMNLGDRTMKSEKMSSKHYYNTSEIFKKDQDSMINQNIIDNLTEHSLKFKKNNTSGNELVLSQHEPLYATSPKFAQAIGTAKTIQQPSKKQITLRPVAPSSERKYFENANNLNNPNGQSGFRKKENIINKNEEEYKQVEHQIRFYHQSLEKMIYQSQRMEEETEELMINFNTASYEAELSSLSKDISAINSKIEEERNLQIQLNKMVAQLHEDYYNIANSVRTSNFPRPVRIKDDAKAILDEINSLKAEFEGLQRDDGSLNLSSTLIGNRNEQVGSTFRGTIKKDSNIGQQLISQIYAQNKKSEDPRFLYNIKMSCLKDQWNLFSNSQLHINVSYRETPKIKLTLGNKLSKDLETFSLIEGKNTKYSGQTISAKSYLLHETQISEKNIDQLFIKYELSYLVLGVKKQMVLFVPTGLLTFGEFSPITQKQFYNEAGKQQFEYSTGSRPIDKKLAGSLTEIQHYLPNMTLQKDGGKFLGLHVSPFNEITFVNITQKGQLYSIAAKTSNYPLLKFIEFVFTL